MNWNKPEDLIIDHSRASIPADILFSPACGYMGSYNLVHNHYRSLNQIVFYSLILPSENTTAIFRVHVKAKYHISYN